MISSASQPPCLTRCVPEQTHLPTLESDEGRRRRSKSRRFTRRIWRRWSWRRSLRWHPRDHPRPRVLVALRPLLVRNHRHPPRRTMQQLVQMYLLAGAARWDPPPAQIRTACQWHQTSPRLHLPVGTSSQLPWTLSGRIFRLRKTLPLRPCRLHPLGHHELRRPADLFLSQARSPRKLRPRSRRRSPHSRTITLARPTLPVASSRRPRSRASLPLSRTEAPMHLR